MWFLSVIGLRVKPSGCANIFLSIRLSRRTGVCSYAKQRILCLRVWGVTEYDSDYCFNCLSSFNHSRGYMTFFDCTADLVGQLNGNGQKGMLHIRVVHGSISCDPTQPDPTQPNQPMGQPNPWTTLLQIDAPPIENFWLRHWILAIRKLHLGQIRCNHSSGPFSVTLATIFNPAFNLYEAQFQWSEGEANEHLIN